MQSASVFDFVAYVLGTIVLSIEFLNQTQGYDQQD